MTFSTVQNVSIYCWASALWKSWWRTNKMLNIYKNMGIMWIIRSTLASNSWFSYWVFSVFSIHHSNAIHHFYVVTHWVVSQIRALNESRVWCVWWCVTFCYFFISCEEEEDEKKTSEGWIKNENTNEDKHNENILQKNRERETEGSSERWINETRISKSKFESKPHHIS